jgi:hypothetical protein
MSGQSSMLEELVTHFKLRPQEEEAAPDSVMIVAAPALARSSGFALVQGGTGKY